MNFWTKKSEWTNWELSLIKISLVALGMAIGSYFPEQIRRYAILLIVVWIGVKLYLSPKWIRQMGKK